MKEIGCVLGIKKKNKGGIRKDVDLNKSKSIRMINL